MIQDAQTNFLYLADSLNQKKYLLFLERFENVLRENSIHYEFLKGTRDIWAVDYMPVQLQKDKFFQFKYDPDYLKYKKYENTKSDGNAICESIDIKSSKSDIVLDGGNVVRSANKVIMTNKVFSENPYIPEKQLILNLKSLFDVDKIVFIPVEKSDFIGHADGMVRFINEDKVFINKYSDKDRKFERVLKDCLYNADLDWVEMPYNPYKNDTNLSAKGIYINYLQMKDVIILPTFGLPEDDEALGIVKEYFKDYTISTINCEEIAAEGGVLNCISWDIFKN